MKDIELFFRGILHAVGLFCMLVGLIGGFVSFLFILGYIASIFFSVVGVGFAPVLEVLLYSFYAFCAGVVCFGMFKTGLFLSVNNSL